MDIDLRRDINGDHSTRASLEAAAETPQRLEGDSPLILRGVRWKRHPIGGMAAAASDASKCQLAVLLDDDVDDVTVANPKCK